jgi:hypothetical protein
MSRNQVGLQRDLAAMLLTPASHFHGRECALLDHATRRELSWSRNLHATARPNLRLPSLDLPRDRETAS